MSLFQCEQCGCCENTACSNYAWRTYKKMPVLCSACDTDELIGGKGKWHGIFKRTFLPKGKFITNAKGNLAHKDTGDEDFYKYAIEEPSHD
jgi:hypothetical protein